jgi:hypothetical protein
MSELNPSIELVPKDPKLAKLAIAFKMHLDSYVTMQNKIHLLGTYRARSRLEDSLQGNEGLTNLALDNSTARVDEGPL